MTASGALIVGETEPEHIGGGLYGGFLCGLVFCAIAGFASGRCRLAEFSYVRAAAWGAVSGLMVGALPFVLGDSSDREAPVWVLPVMVMAALGLASAVSGIVSVWVARAVKDRESQDAGAHVNG